jgi:hypothetical protein
MMRQATPIERALPRWRVLHNRAQALSNPTARNPYCASPPYKLAAPLLSYSLSAASSPYGSLGELYATPQIGRPTYSYNQVPMMRSLNAFFGAIYEKCALTSPLRSSTFACKEAPNSSSRELPYRMASRFRRSSTDSIFRVL